MFNVPTLNFSDVSGWATYEAWGIVSGIGLEISRLFTSVYTSNTFAPFTPPFANASYDLGFWGPSYKCSSLEAFIERNNTPTWSPNDSNYTSVEEAFYGEIGTWVSPGNASLSGRANVFKAVSSTPMSNTVFIGTSGFNMLGNTTLPNVRLLCQLYNTSYSVTVGFDNGIQTIRENAVEILELQEWNDIRGKYSMALANGTCAPDPEANNAIICPTYYTFHSVLSNFLSGTIFVSGDGDFRYENNGFQTGAGSAPVLQSGLTDCPEIWNYTGIPEAYMKTFHRCRNQTLASAIEDLSRNFTYSLMAYRNWEDVKTLVPMAVTSPMNFFYYNKGYLLAAYITAILVTLICMAIGFVALRNNGFTGSMAFSAVLLTTRNTDLDKLAENHYLGEKPLPDVVCNTKLQFGIIGTEETGNHAGFGLEGTVTPLGSMPPCHNGESKGAETTTLLREEL